MEEDIARIEARANSLVDAHTEHLRELISLRHKHELSQEAVAARMGVSQPTVAAFEHYDSNPTLTTIRRYALAVEAKLDINVIDDCADHNIGDFHEIVSGLSAETSFKTQPDSTSVRRPRKKSVWSIRPPRIVNAND